MWVMTTKINMIGLSEVVIEEVIGEQLNQLYHPYLSVALQYLKWALMIDVTSRWY